MASSSISLSKVTVLHSWFDKSPRTENFESTGKEHDMTLQKNSGAVRRFAKLSRFGAWLQNLPNKIVPPPFRLLQISASYWQSRALYVAARLDIATVLADRSE